MHLINITFIHSPSSRIYVMLNGLKYSALSTCLYRYSHNDIKTEYRDRKFDRQTAKKYNDINKFKKRKEKMNCTLNK